MGMWALMPGDNETWHGEHTSLYSVRHFGIPKESVLIYDVKNNLSHQYVSKSYIHLLYSHIDSLNKKNFKTLSKKLESFYPLVKQAKKVVSKKIKNPTKLTNTELAKQFWLIRDQIHKVVIFDQFAWYAEEYWTPKLKHILLNVFKINQNSIDYNRVLFGLTKPEHISTTLLEKKAVIEASIKIKSGKINIAQGSKQLTKKYGYLPVFAYGEPWQTNHYENELREIIKRPLGKLFAEFEELKNYTKIRNNDFNKIVDKYKIKKVDLQLFIDFSLALDTRNEAEYFVSFGSYFLLPLYQEISRRLFLTSTQVRLLTENELLNAITGKIKLDKIQNILDTRKKYFGWGFKKDFKTRINFSPEESEKLFEHIESYVKPIQSSQKNVGTCASPGTAKGRVRILTSPEQNYKVKNGDILFTYATTTDYLPAMKCAAAIVTEVGGLTCHAAVVSREFGIPCIVALTNCMKNFKDGDLVEVDANKGNIRKIKESIY